MAAAAIRSYADAQIKKINDKIAKLEGDNVEARAKRARLATACQKWMQMKYGAR